MLASQILAKAFMLEGLNITWLPAYGAEMRGGTVNCTLAFLMMKLHRLILICLKIVIALNLPSFEKFEDKIKSGGTLLVNSSLVEAKPKRKRYFLQIRAIDRNCK